MNQIGIVFYANYIVHLAIVRNVQYFGKQDYTVAEEHRIWNGFYITEINMIIMIVGLKSNVPNVRKLLNRK